MHRSHATPLAFKTAVERRFRNEAAASEMDLERRRQLFVFDCVLARLFHALEDAVVLKGGLVIDLRLQAGTDDPGLGSRGLGLATRTRGWLMHVARTSKEIEEEATCTCPV